MMGLFSSGKVRVAILLPIADGMKGRTVQSLCDLMTSTKIPMGAAVTSGSRLVDKCRNELVQYAINQNYTHCLFIDSDMVFPADTLERLLSHGKDIVGCAYVSRGNLPVPYLFGEFEADGQVKLRVDEIMKPNGHSLTEVGAIAAGMLLVRLEVFKKIKSPYFKFEDDLVGEDLYFSKKAKEAGFQIFCDLKLSEQLEHLGEDGRTLGMFRSWAMTPTGRKFLEDNHSIIQGGN